MQEEINFGFIIKNAFWPAITSSRVISSLVVGECFLILLSFLVIYFIWKNKYSYSEKIASLVLEQTSDKDHAIRCLSMAVKMQERMKALQKIWFDRGVNETLKIRCGINTGMATVGNFGSTTRKLYTAHGMQVNIAARLEQACEPGAVLISHSTWGLIHNEIPCTPKKEVEVKGVNYGLKVYEVDL